MIGTRSVRDVYADLFEEWQVANTLARGTYSEVSITAPYDNRGGMAKHITGEAVPWGTQHWYSPGNPATEYASARNFVQIANRYGMNAKIIEYPTPIPRTYTKESYRYNEAADMLEPGALMPMFGSQKEANAAYNIGIKEREQTGEVSSDVISDLLGLETPSPKTPREFPEPQGIKHVNNPTTTVEILPGMAKWDYGRTNIPIFDAYITGEEVGHSGVGVNAELKWMSPDEFINKQKTILAMRPIVSSELRPTDIGNIGDIRFTRGISPIKLESVKIAMQKPMNTFSALVIEREEGGSLKDYQEGRHRAVAAKELGYEKIPVWELTDTTKMRLHGPDWENTGTISRYAAMEKIQERYPEQREFWYSYLYNRKTPSVNAGVALRNIIEPEEIEEFPEPELIFEGREEGIPVEADRLQFETMKEISPRSCSG